MATHYQGRIGAGLYAPLTQHLSPLGSHRQIIEAVGALLEELTREGLLATQPADGICEVTESVLHRATVQLPFSKRVFAIPDSELKIWESGATVAASFLGASLMDGATAVEKIAGGLLTGLIHGVFTALIACWKKHAFLPEAQGELLLALKRRPNSTVEGLLMQVSDDLNISVEQATAALAALKSVRLSNGKLVAFVEEEGGRWWAVDV